MTKPKTYSHGMTLKQAKNSLGKHPAAPFDSSKHLDMSRYFAAAAILPRTLARDFTPLATIWGMLGNDQLGDCTCAGLLHATQASKFLESKILASVTTDTAVSLYELLCGYVPGDPSTDQGGSEDDVLATAATSADAKNLMGDTIRAHARVPFNADNFDAVKQTIDQLGFAYIGVAMPQAWCTGPEVWDVPTTPAASQVEGGHCVILINYDDDAQAFTLVSWGRTYTMTYAAFARYVDEVHAVILASWVAANGTDPDGIDLTALLSDFQTITGQTVDQIAVPSPSFIENILPEVEAVVEHVADDLIGHIKSPFWKLVAKDSLAGVLAGVTAAATAYASNLSGASIAEIGVAAGVVGAGFNHATIAQLVALEQRLVTKIEALLAKHKAGA